MASTLTWQNLWYNLTLNVWYFHSSFKSYQRLYFFLQVGRSTESPIDFVVTDTISGSQNNDETQITQSTISRFACRIVCDRSPPYTARIFAAGFDSSKNIFLGVSTATDYATCEQTPFSFLYVQAPRFSCTSQWLILSLVFYYCGVPATVLSRSCSFMCQIYYQHGLLVIITNEVLLQ